MAFLHGTRQLRSVHRRQGPAETWGQVVLPLHVGELVVQVGQQARLRVAVRSVQHLRSGPALTPGASARVQRRARPNRDRRAQARTGDVPCGAEHGLAGGPLRTCALARPIMEGICFRSCPMMSTCMRHARTRFTNSFTARSRQTSLAAPSNPRTRRLCQKAQVSWTSMGMSPPPMR